MYHLYKKIDINNCSAKLNSTIKIKTQMILSLLLFNPNGIIFNFYEMKPKYILLKDFPIPIQIVEILLKLLYHNSFKDIFSSN